MGTSGAKAQVRGGRGTLIKKMPFVSGGGSAGWCGWNTGCHRRSVVDRGKRSGGGRSHFSQTGVCGVRAEWTGRNAQVFLPPPGLGPVTLSKLVTPLLFCFLVSSSHHRGAVHFLITLLGSLPTPTHHLHACALVLNSPTRANLCLIVLGCIPSAQTCARHSRQVFAGQMDAFAGPMRGCIDQDALPLLSSL